MLKYIIGRRGFIAAEQKREGDGCTPLGTYPLREVWYRPERVSRLNTKLPVHEITPNDCWCDDATHPLYNRHFKLSPLLQGGGFSFEQLWREDGAYDVIVVIGYNDDPPIPHKGSAIFIHCEHDDGRPTAGCVAMSKKDLLELLKKCDVHTHIVITKDSIRFDSA
jgi:L,D-peptidoglycan transpeptidase YkuD (ErfK/YbiS/YcfS/YnhG family)